MKCTGITTALAVVGLVNMAAAAVTAPKLLGCYNSPANLKDRKKDFSVENSSGKCRTLCVDDETKKGNLGFSVQGMAGSICVCGNTLPNKAHRVELSKCSYSCPGYGDEACGTRNGNFWSVWGTGLEEVIEEDAQPVLDTSSTSSKPAGPPPTTTVIKSSEEASEENKKSSVNKGAVAAGVVVGVLVVLSIGAGAFLLIRKRNRQKVEEEYKRSAAIREFHQKPASDHRLDPGMVQRRDSAGSIADNQDYSRRILKVTNPDG